jgi:sec-independent protein translocase protein TatA
MFTGLLQPTHLLILLGAALIFLGPKRLPDAGRALGQGLREFKASVSPEEQPPLPEAAVTADEQSHPVQHGDTAANRHAETPPVQ